MSGSPGPESERKLPRVLPALHRRLVAIRISPIFRGAQILGLRRGEAALDDFLAIVRVKLDHRGGVTEPPQRYFTFVRLERRFLPRGGE
jgi:hypothetical protein